jgi:hypothetical protein
VHPLSSHIQTQGCIQTYLYFELAYEDSVKCGGACSPVIVLFMDVSFILVLSSGGTYLSKDF